MRRPRQRGMSTPSTARIVCHIFPAASFVVICALLPLMLCPETLAQTVNPRQLFDKALADQQHGNLHRAAQEYQDLVRLHPEITAARANLAGVLVSLGRFDEAITQYRAALEQAPGNQALELNLGLAYFKKGEVREAAALFTSLHQADPTNERVAILLSDCDLRLNQAAEVVPLLAPFEAGDPDNLDLEWALGSAMIGTGQTREGLKRVEKVAQEGRSGKAYLLAARTYLRMERFDLARQDIEAAKRLNPKLPGLDTAYGIVMEDFGDPKGAEIAFEKALKSNPQDFEAELHLGALLFKQRRLADSTLHLSRALQIQPSSSLAHYELGLVEKTEGYLEPAVKDLETAEHEDPHWVAPHIELTALYYRLKRPKDGAREKQIVDRLTMEQQRASQSRVISPGVPSP
jgi:tetratricopeptide (TPR) repeat protein